jgi:hypothetical protein
VLGAEVLQRAQLRWRAQHARQLAVQHAAARVRHLMREALVRGQREREVVVAVPEALLLDEAIWVEVGPGATAHMRHK